MVALLDKSLLPPKQRPIAIIPIFEGTDTPEKASMKHYQFSYTTGSSQESLAASLKLAQYLREAGITVYHANNQIW
jgi:hypothetical protein